MILNSNFMSKRQCYKIFSALFYEPNRPKFLIKMLKPFCFKKISFTKIFYLNVVVVSATLLSQVFAMAPIPLRPKKYLLNMDQDIETESYPDTLEIQNPKQILRSNFRCEFKI